VTFSLLAGTITLLCLWRLHRGVHRSFFPSKCCGRRDKSPSVEVEKAVSNGWGDAEAARRYLGGMPRRKVYLTDLKRERQAGEMESQDTLSPLPPKIVPPSATIPSSPGITPTRGILKKPGPHHSPASPGSPKRLVRHSESRMPRSAPAPVKDRMKRETTSFGLTESTASPLNSVYQRNTITSQFQHCAPTPYGLEIPSPRPFPVKERDLKYRSGPAYPPSVLTSSSSNGSPLLPPSQSVHYTLPTPQSTPVGPSVPPSMPTPPIQSYCDTPIAARFAKTIPIRPAMAVLPHSDLTVPPPAQPLQPPIVGYNTTSPLPAPSPSFPFPSYRENGSVHSGSTASPRVSAPVQYDVRGRPGNIASRHRLG
jgi:hypothetical protein